MEENFNIRCLFSLKLIALILLPVFIILAIIYGITIGYAIENPEVKTNQDFYKTEMFSDAYKSQLYSKCGRITRAMNRSYAVNEYGIMEESIISGMNAITEGDYTIYYEQNYRKQKFKYVIVNPELRQVYTNVEQTTKTDTIQEIKEFILTDICYWSYSNEEIQTNIENLSKDNLMYDSTFVNIKEKIKTGEFYTSFDENVNHATNQDDISTNKTLYTFVQKIYPSSYTIFVISIIGLFITSIYLVLSTGYKKRVKGIHLDWLDKLPLELMGTITLCVLAIEIGLIALGCYCMQVDTDLGFLILVMSSYVFIFTGTYALGSVLKRIKAKQFFSNTYIARMWNWLKKIGCKIRNRIFDNQKESIKLAVYMGTFIIVSGLLLLIFESFGIVLDIVFWVFCYWKVLKTIEEFQNVKKAIESIYEGNTDINLKEEELTGVLKELAIYINDIAGGFSNAIQESLKSERLKTELITNVSHDIKTPLTSIINYVDLLKKEEIQNDTARKYLEVLDQKSQRLKKLIEDLVEASKASSGNIKLHMEKLNVNELIKQVTGEFGDKFEKRKLEVIMDFPEEDTYIMGDSRYLYRVIENLYSNVAKYALENSRVYIDGKKEKENMIITIKNISKEQLNISSDELMQRFVRGDSSRNTEGSGLGLSIARSLTELQNGKFEIFLDGDLFKVTIIFEQVK